MATKLTVGQRHVLDRIKAIGDEVGATPKERKAAIETGLVESNLRNLPGGDADSAGWRQERASLYRNPTNLDASIRRFYRETRSARGQYGRAGDLAAAVQRPASQFRGRYQGVSGQAQALLGGGGVAPQSARQITRTVTPGVDNSALRGQLIQQFLGRSNVDPLDFAMGIHAAQDVAPVTRTSTTPTPASTPSSGAPAGLRGKSPLLELFWQGRGGINVKNGAKVPQGFVSGHQDHVHVGAGPKTVVELGKLAQSMGLQVGENPHFGKVNPVHVKNSLHYKGEAIDVSGDPARMRAYAHRVAKLYGIR
jgi:hypothetical protein